MSALVGSIVGALLVAVAALVAWFRRKPAAPPDTRAIDSKADKREGAADAKLADGLHEIEERAERAKGLSDLDRAAALFDSSKGRKAPLLLALLLLSAPARALDCAEAPGGVLCSRAQFHEIVVKSEALRDERDAKILKIAALEEKLDAERERSASARALPPVVVESISWPWVAGAGLVGFLLGVLVTR